MRKRSRRKASSVNESTASLKSKVLFRASNRKRSWISKQSFPSRKQSGFASFFSTGGGGAVDFASISACPANAAEAHRTAMIASKAGIFLIIFVGSFGSDFHQQNDNRTIAKS